MSTSSRAGKRLERLNQTLTPPKAREVNRTELSPIDFVYRSSLLYPTSTAISYQGLTLTYPQLVTRILKSAQLLTEKYNIQRGDKVGLFLRNVPAIYDSHFSIPLVGGVIVAINTRLSKDEVKYIVDHSQIKFLIYEKEYEPILTSLPSSLTKVVVGEPALSSEYNANDPSFKDSWEGQLANFTGPIKPWNHYNEVRSNISEDDMIAVSYTSGTTGKPKGVMLTYRGVTLMALNAIIEFQFVKESKYMWILPIFHCNGWCIPWALAAVSACNLLVKKVDSANIWDQFLNHGASHYCGTPTVQISIVNDPIAQPLKNKVIAVVAGSPPSPNLISKMEALNLYPKHGYGLTETLGPCTSGYIQDSWYELNAQQRADKMAQQGQSFLLADRVRVVDSDMQDVPADGKTVGEVVFRGNLLMKGYYRDSEATQKAFHGGWFHSGDLAVMEPQLYVRLVDRSKDIIISGGENISSVEIENIMATHPNVLEVAVVSSPHPKWGETPKAFVVLKNGSQGGQEVEQELIKYCRANLAHFKCPTKVELLQQLPKTG